MTHSFFDKLVKQLEKGFAGIERDYQGELPAALVEPAGGGGDGAGPSSSGGAAGAAAAAGGSSGKKRRGGGKAARAGEWVCAHCTLSNNGGHDCEACGLPRPD